MGHMATDSIALLRFSAVLLVCSCGPAGVGGGGADPAPADPLPMADLVSHLDGAGETPPEIFTSDVPLRVVLAADLDQLGKDRSQESEERPGQLLLLGRDGEPTEIRMQVKTRGNFRLNRRICSDPPLRLNLQETVSNGTVFDGHDKLKLVTHCRDSDRYEQNILEEYLVYRIYNELTDLSFRVQLADISYLATRGGDDPVRRLGFFIEDEDVLAERVGGTMVETSTANPRDFVLDQLSLMYLFQFMVGNVDWGTGVGHNLKFLLKEREYFPIPYDFDWSGFVDAPYAGPNPLTEPYHDSVRERLYWGACMSEIDFPELFRQFNGKRNAIMELVTNQVGLSESNRKSAVGYLEDFFDIIDNPRQAKRWIVDACRSS